MNLQQLLDSVGAEHGQGVEVAAVSQAEQQIGPLPEDYRAFLLEVGWTAFGAEDVAGLGLDLPHRWQNVVELTQKERRDGGLPEHLVALHGDGGGNFACLYEGRVVLWVHDDPVLQELAATFSDWLERLLETAI
jgi:hypothetical protein